MLNRNNRQLNRKLECDFYFLTIFQTDRKIILSLIKRYQQRTTPILKLFLKIWIRFFKNYRLCLAY